MEQVLFLLKKIYKSEKKIKTNSFRKAVKIKLEGIFLKILKDFFKIKNANFKVTTA